MLDYIDMMLIFIEGDDKFQAKVIVYWAFQLYFYEKL